MINAANEIIKSSATTSNFSKTFIIPHPLDDDRYLVHGCLEGPEVGVYYRGKSSITTDTDHVTVQLPHYVDAIATDFDVFVTPLGKVFNPLSVDNISAKSFDVYGKPGKFSWYAIGKRRDVEVEPLKSECILRGDGPYTYLE